MLVGSSFQSSRKITEKALLLMREELNQWEIRSREEAEKKIQAEKA